MCSRNTRISILLVIGLFLVLIQVKTEIMGHSTATSQNPSIYLPTQHPPLTQEIGNRNQNSNSVEEGNSTVEMNQTIDENQRENITQANEGGKTALITTYQTSNETQIVNQGYADLTLFNLASSLFSNSDNPTIKPNATKTVQNAANSSELSNQSTFAPALANVSNQGALDQSYNSNNRMMNTSEAQSFQDQLLSLQQKVVSPAFNQFNSTSSNQAVSKQDNFTQALQNDSNSTIYSSFLEDLKGSIQSRFDSFFIN